MTVITKTSLTLPSRPLNSIQFNEDDSFGGDAELAWNSSTKTFTLHGDTNSDRWDNADENTFFGMLVGGDGTLSGALHNTGIGFKALESIVGGDSNTALGSRTLRDLLNGTFNTCVGDLCGKVVIGGDFNTGHGASALEALTNGNHNTGIGFKAAFSLTTTLGTTSVGAFSMQNATTPGNFNAAFGYQAMTSAAGLGQKNIAIGFGSMASAGSTNHSIGIGTEASPLVTGDNNIGIGREVLRLLTSGANNVAIGFRAGDTNVSGVRNVFIGFEAGGLETGSRRFYVSDSDTATPLLYGEFDNKVLRTNGTFKAVGYFAAVTEISSNTTLDETHSTVHCDASGGAFNVTLPSVATFDEREYTIKKIDNSSNAITLIGTVDGETNPTIIFQYDSITIQPDGTEWWIL